MTINRSLYNADLNIYFHMKNHYKKLKNVKSTIDNSTPQGFRRSCPTPNNTPASLETSDCTERQARRSLQLSGDNIDTLKQLIPRHSVGSQSETCVRSSSLPPRPMTRRHPFEMPQKLQCKIRSQSVGAMSRKDLYARFNNKASKKRRSSRRKAKDVHKVTPRAQNKKDANSKNDESSKENWSRSKGKAAFRTEEQEYLQFLLRITEDIIINNYHTSEDVEKVFQNHVQANRGHLKLSKMRAQLVRLCGELNIPYNNNGILLNKDECYQKFFQTDCNSNCYQNFDNCECGTNRVLGLEIKDQNKIPRKMQEGEQYNFILANDVTQANFNMLMSKHSLSRVTECTEPSNSLDTLMASTKHPSGTTVSSLGNIDALLGLENQNTKIDRGLFEEVVGRVLSNDIVASKELLLTEKEKNSCAEEASIFEKYSKFPIKYEDNYIENIDFVTVILPDDKPLQSDKPNNEEIPENSLNVVECVNRSKANLNINEISKEIDNVHVAKLDKNMFESAQRNDDSASEMGDKIETVDTNALKITYNKHTQMSASCADKQCNTSLKLNGYAKNDDYILVNGPMYVLKTLLDSDEKLILYNRPVIDNINGALSSPPPNVVRDNNFSRLLNSDYDLTPEREVNCDSDKYHHLSVDATTSISNMNLNKSQFSNLNYESLLLTEGYIVNGRKEFESYRGFENDNLLLSGYTFSSDGQYEIDNYTIQHEVNRSIGIYSCSVGFQPGNENESFDQIIEQDVSLGQYEIYSQDGKFRENYDVDDSEENSKTEGSVKVKMEENKITPSIIQIRNGAKYKSV